MIKNRQDGDRFSVPDLFALLLFFTCMQLHVTAEDEESCRMIVYKNDRHYYNVEGDSFFSLPTRFIVTDDLFGTEKPPASLLKNKDITENPGFQFGFASYF